MFFKRVIFLSVLLLLFCNAVAFANTDDKTIHENGFRELNWGESIDAFSQKGIEFAELNFDRNKKLFNYMRRVESYSIYETGFYPIYYHFWDDKFVAVRAYFNAEKDTGAFQRIYDSLAARFGVSQTLDSTNTQEEPIFWRAGQTSIILHYNMTTKMGSIYIFNPQLQNEYSTFVKSLPAQPLTYQNQPDGFSDMAWGKTFEELKSEGKKFKVNKKDSIVGDFTLDGDNNDFLGVPVIRKTYSFWEKQLFCAYVHYQSGDEKAAFNKIYGKMNEEYGLPTYGRYSEAEKAYYYTWPGESTYILLYYFLDKKESYVFFTSKPLYDKQTVTNS